MSEDKNKMAETAEKAKKASSKALAASRSGVAALVRSLAKRPSPRERVRQALKNSEILQKNLDLILVQALGLPAVVVASSLSRGDISVGTIVALFSMPAALMILEGIQKVAVNMKKKSEPEKKKESGEE